MQCMQTYDYEDASVSSSSNASLILREKYVNI
jgi:hypothetical protein